MSFRVIGASVIVAVLPCARCASAGGGPCMDYTQIVAPVTGLDTEACDVTLDPSGGAAPRGSSVVIHFPAACLPGDGGLGDVAPDAACGVGTEVSGVSCSSVAGPKPNGCRRDRYLMVDFMGGTLRSFLGPMFTVTVTCGGKTLIQRDEMIGCSRGL